MAQHDALPRDLAEGAFALRAMTPEGPSVFALQGGAAFDMTPAFGTCSAWLSSEDPVAAIRARGVPAVLDLPAALANAHHAARDPARPWLLAPVDLQVLKAAGVTYVRSMLERVIEERCRGDATQAEAVRAEVRDIIGDDLQNLIPGSAEATRVKAALVAKGWWSQYLEVGIGPDAEVFTKSPVLSAVGPAQGRRASDELLVEPGARGGDGGEREGQDRRRDARQRRQPARRGGRSALLLGRAKDNNASCALGPMIRCSMPLRAGGCAPRRDRGDDHRPRRLRAAGARRSARSAATRRSWSAS
jgi:fumarylacetoacetate (FAA) hydrolase family protein